MPYLLIVGDREVEDGTVSVRSHDYGDEGPVRLEAFAERLAEEVRTRKLPEEF